MSNEKERWIEYRFDSVAMDILTYEELLSKVELYKEYVKNKEENND